MLVLTNESRGEDTSTLHKLEHVTNNLISDLAHLNEAISLVALLGANLNADTLARYDLNEASSHKTTDLKITLFLIQQHAESAVANIAHVNAASSLELLGTALQVG